MHLFPKGTVASLCLSLLRDTSRLLTSKMLRHSFLAVAMATTISCGGGGSVPSPSTPAVPVSLLASTTQLITAAQGGTLTLPDGSSATIPPGLLSSDQSVTLSQYSGPLTQPNQLLGAVGPALYLTFSGPVNFQEKQKRAIRKDQASSKDQTGIISAAGITFNFNFISADIANLSGAIANASFIDQAGNTIHQAISGTINLVEKTGMAFLEATCIPLLGDITSSKDFIIGATFVTVLPKPANAPEPGLLSWNLSANSWSSNAITNAASFKCPAIPPNRTLVVVHGMFSSVESSSFLTMVKAITPAVGYQTVLGFDYEWWNGIDVNGLILAGFLDRISSCGQSIDVLAHSEGVPVSMYAMTQVSSSTKAVIQHFVALGGPILGTPVANVFQKKLGPGRYALATFAANLPDQVMVYPPLSLGGIAGVLNSQFVSDLEDPSRTAMF